MQFLYLKNILNKNIKLKYERLEKLYREAEKQCSSFALDKDNIYYWVSKLWIKKLIV